MAKELRGLPGGANEYITHPDQFFSIEGYKRDSPDVNNPYNIIPSGKITMKGVDFPVLGVDNHGNKKLMRPGQEYQFPGDQVFEIPMAQKGGTPRKPIIVTDKKDKRLQAYNDSLNLYNNYEKYNKAYAQLANKYNLKTWKDSNAYNPGAKIQPVSSQGFVFAGGDSEVNGDDISDFLITKSNKNVQIMSDSPEIKNIFKGSGRKFGANLHGYKKPVQPVVYQKPKPTNLINIDSRGVKGKYDNKTNSIFGTLDPNVEYEQIGESLFKPKAIKKEVPKPIVPNLNVSGNTYQDSLNLYNAYEFQKKNTNYKALVADYAKALNMPPQKLQETRNKNLGKPGTLVKGAKKFNYNTFFKDTKDLDPPEKKYGDIKILDYYNSLKFDEPVRIGNYSSPDIVHKTIKPTGMYTDGNSLSPVYKRPIGSTEFRENQKPEVRFTKEELKQFGPVTPFSEENIAKDLYLQEIAKEKIKPITYQKDDKGQYHFEYPKESTKTNFEQRIQTPTETIKNPDGTISTHKMMSWESDGKYYAAPTIVEQNGKLVELTPDMAIDYAFKNNEFKEFKTDQEAKDYANNGYKVGTPMDIANFNEYDRAISEGAFKIKAMENDPEYLKTKDFQKQKEYFKSKGYSFHSGVMGNYNLPRNEWVKDPLGTINIEGRNVPYYTTEELDKYQSYKPTRVGASNNYTIPRFESPLYWEGNKVMDKNTKKPIFQDGAEVPGRNKGNVLSDLVHSNKQIQKTYQMGDKYDNGWYANWLQHPETLKRLSETDIVTDPNVLQKTIIDPSINNLKTLPVYDEDKLLYDNTYLNGYLEDSDLKYNNKLQGFKGSNKIDDYKLPEKVAGLYDPNSHFAVLNSFTNTPTGAHELTHATSNWADEQEAILRAYFPNEFSVTKPAQPSVSNDLTTDEREYLDEDGLFPRVMGLRRSLDLSPGDVVDKEMFKNLDNQAIRDLRKFYDDDTIVKILNTLADNNGEQLDRGQYGGEGKVHPMLKTNDPTKVKNYQDSLYMHNFTAGSNPVNVKTNLAYQFHDAQDNSRYGPLSLDNPNAPFDENSGFHGSRIKTQVTKKDTFSNNRSPKYNQFIKDQSKGRVENKPIGYMNIEEYEYYPLGPFFTYVPESGAYLPPNTKFIEDKTNLKELQKIYPLLTAEILKEMVMNTRDNPSYVRKGLNAYNEYEYDYDHFYTDDPKKGYLQDHIVNDINIYKSGYPLFKKPVQPYELHSTESPQPVEPVEPAKPVLGTINIEGRQVPYHSDEELKLFSPYKPTKIGGSNNYNISRFESPLYWEGDKVMDKNTGKPLFQKGGQPILNWFQKGKEIPKPFNPLPGLTRPTANTSDNTRRQVPLAPILPGERLKKDIRIAQQHQPELKLTDSELRLKDAEEANKIPYTSDNWADVLARRTQATGDKLNIPGVPDIIDPLAWVGSMASELGRVPLNINEGNYRDAAMAFVNPLLMGRAMGSGSINPLGKKFWTNEVSNPEFLNSMAMGVPGLAKGFANKVVPNAHILNPYAYQYNLPKDKMWRGLGKKGADDALESGVFRANQNVEPTMYEGVDLSKRFNNVYYTPNFKTAETYGQGFIAEVPKDAANFTNRYTRGKDWSQLTKEQIPIEQGRILQKDWWKGYKQVEVPKEVPKTSTKGIQFSKSDEALPKNNTPLKLFPQENVLKSELDSQNIILKEDLDNIIKRHTDWLDSPEYMKRRMAGTGETENEILKDINFFKDNIKKTKFSLQKPVKGQLGSYNKYNNSIILNNDLSRETALAVLEHEVLHGMTPNTTPNFFEGFINPSGYKNYPKLDTGSFLGNLFNKHSRYHKSAAEQNVRHERLLNFLEDTQGIKKGTPLTIDDINTFVGNINKGGKYENKFRFKADAPNNDIDQLLRLSAEDAKRTGKNFREELLNVLNKAWMVPSAIIGANQLQEKQYGGESIWDNASKQFAEGGETTIALNIYKDYVDGIYDGTPEENHAKRVFDRLNIKHLHNARKQGMSPANYVMTNLLSLNKSAI